MFFWPSFWPRTGWQARSVDRSVDRTKGRSTVQSTDVHRAVHVWQHGGPVDRPGRPDQRALLSVSGRSTGRSTGCPNGHKYDRWRSTGRLTASLFGWQIGQTASLLERLFKPHFLGGLDKIFKSKNFYFSVVFLQVLKSVLELKRFHLYCFSRVLKNQRKLGFWDIVLDFHFYHLQEISQVVFLCYLISKNTLMSTWAISSILIYLGSLFCGKEIVWGWLSLQVVNPPWLVVSLFGRGWSEWCLLPLVRGGDWL